MRARAGMPPFYREHTGDEISEILGLTQSYVSRLEKIVLGKLALLIDEVDAID